MRGPNKTICLFLTLFCAGYLQGITQISREWTGTGNWSQFNNWTPAGNPVNAKLEWKGTGDPLSYNDQTGQYYQRLYFNGLQSYILSGNLISIANPGVGEQGIIVNESEVQQNIQAPLLFNDNAKTALISNLTFGRLVINSLGLGNNLLGLRIYGSVRDGNITIANDITGSKPILCGIDKDDAIMSETRVFFLGNNAGFAGPIKVYGGILVIKNSNGLGPSATNFTEVFPGATVELQGGINLSATATRKFNIQGNGFENSNGAINSAADSNVIGTDILLSGNSIINCAGGSKLVLGNIGKYGGNVDWNLHFSGEGSVYLNGTMGIINGGAALGSLVKSGIGLLTISGKCVYSGETSILAGGRLQLGGNNVLPITTGLSLNGAEFRTGATVGYSQQMGPLVLSYNSSGIILAPGNHTLRFANSRFETWSPERRLYISGWSGKEGEKGSDSTGKIFIDPLDATTPGLTEEQLAMITFNGFCDGAALLASGELVPAKRPFITAVTGRQPYTGTTLNYAGYTGDTITITGCQFFGATEVRIDTFRILPPDFIETGNKILLPLADSVGGLITVITAFGERTNTIPLVNLGYITRIGVSGSSQNWTSDTIWQGMHMPPAGRSVTIAHNNTAVNTIIPLLNTQYPYTNTLSIVAGSLRLTGNQFIPSGTPLVMAGGILRCANRASNAPNKNFPGYSQTFHTLTLSGTATIVLDSFPGRTNGYHILKFSPSSHLSWVPGAVLNIINWAGLEAQPGTRGRIFIGDSSTGSAGLTVEQLRQIKFDNRCQGAKLLPSGELVPSDAPFISKIVGNPGGLNQAYVGSDISLYGCKMDSVLVVKLGDITITPFKSTGDSVINFNYLDELPLEKVKLFTYHIPAKEGISASFIFPLGYITNNDGNWSINNTWLGKNIPPAAKNVTVRNALVVDYNITNSPDSFVVNPGGSVTWSNDAVLNISKGIINNGIILPAGSGRINFSDGAFLTNNGTFASNGFGTVSFLGNGTIGGSAPVIFNNLVIHTGSLLLPTSVGGSTVTTPVVEGEFRINGGGLSASNLTGPKYAAGASLVYASGTYQRRFAEWNGVPNLLNPGYPHHVVVENGTNLVLDGPPNPASSNLVCGGSLLVKNGSVRADGSIPLEIRGDLQLGTETNSKGYLNLGRLSGEDANLPAPRLNWSKNYIILHGSFIRYPNSVFNYRANRRQLVFAGNTNSIIRTPGFSVTRGDTTLAFYHVIMSKNGSVTLETPVGIRDSIEFNSGIIKADSINILRIEAIAKAKGGNQNSFTSGPLVKVTGGISHPNALNDFEFKIGRDVSGFPVYAPARLANMVHNGSTTYSGEFHLSSCSNPPFNPPPFADAILQGIIANQWWDVKRLSGSGQGRVGLIYVPVPADAWTPLAPDNNCNIGVVQYTGVSWELTRPDFSFQDTTFAYPEFLPVNFSDTVFSGVLASFSPFTIGFGYNKILPLQLTGFTARLAGDDALLEWIISDSRDLNYFEVEHSTDGRGFLKIGTVTSLDIKAYTFRHLKPGPGIHYYRIKLVEKGGRYSYSPIELVQVGKWVTVIYGLSPNPAINGITRVKVFSAKEQQAEIAVFDIAGRQVFCQRSRLMVGYNNMEVSLLPLPSATYRLLVRTADGVEKQLPLMK